MVNVEQQKPIDLLEDVPKIRNLSFHAKHMDKALKASRPMKVTALR
jgi:hypothetical protein